VQSSVSRRAFLRSAGRSAVLGGLAATGFLGLQSVTGRNLPQACAAPAEIGTPLVWVWKFSADGSPEVIREDLAANALGMLLKTNDGTSWMTRFDATEHAVTGPGQVEKLARFYEDAGVPFHAWFVAQGLDPIYEARMASDVLSAGARSIYIDLEPAEGAFYWQGTPYDALVFGEELRRLSPNAIVTVAPDARPWQMPKVPILEYLSFSNRVAPQSYWATFNSPTNLRYLGEHGFNVGPEGFTPELVVEVARATFGFAGLPIDPIGQGASPPDHWQRFMSASAASNMGPVSLWRYGVADKASFPVIRAMHESARSIQAKPRALDEAGASALSGDTSADAGQMAPVRVSEVTSSRNVAECR